MKTGIVPVSDEMIAEYRRIMDGGEPISPPDAAAQLEARAWLAGRLQQARAVRVMEQQTGPINIQVGSGDAESIARGIGESLRRYAAARAPVQPPPTHTVPMPARALGKT